MRNRFEPGQVVRAGFGSGRIAVTQGVMVATVYQHGRATQAAIAGWFAKERRRKAGQKERTHRGGHGSWAGSVKTFREPAMLKTAPLDCETKGNLRVKRRDPWSRANAPPKAVAVPDQVVKTRKEHHSRVLAWFAGRWRNHQSKRAEKPHSKSSGGNALDGPATRPVTPLAVENSVGKPAAHEAPNVGPGKRAWRTPIPHFGPRLGVKPRAGAFVCTGSQTGVPLPDQALVSSSGFAKRLDAGCGGAMPPASGGVAPHPKECAAFWRGGGMNQG